MASGCVVEYHGKRGTVYRLKFVDASGRQVMETVGPAKTRGRPEGFTRREAEVSIREAGCDRYLAKPVERWRLLELVAQCLPTHRPMAAVG